MGEYVCLERMAAPTPNKGCLWCPTTDPPLFMYRLSATTVGPWEGPFCSKRCLIAYKDDASLKKLYVHTLWPNGRSDTTVPKSKRK
jgi:hypothetical protein